MHIAKGEDRKVFVFPSLGFVVKIPRVHIKKAVNQTRFFSDRESWGSLRKCWSFGIKSRGFIRNMLLGGIYANRIEYIFWKRTKHNFLVPTIFSLFGIINIQKYAEPLSEDYNGIGRVLHKRTGGKTKVSNHTFENPHNFCRHGEFIRMIDYGDERVWKAILKCGDDMCLVTIESCYVIPDQTTE